jgi:preprotein translocase subunit SecA
MKTGEGKTLVATMPLYLNSLLGRGAHLVTVNDYLANRDANWMKPIYDALGVSVGVIQAEQDPETRRRQYECDITYGTNSEFGFDYLRDNLAQQMEQCVQRGHYYAIVDEVDSILIDEARTPLIISGQPEEAPETYYTFAKVATTLKVPGDYEVDEKKKTVAPTEEGVHKVERALGIQNLYAAENSQLVNHLVQALKAESLYKRDVEYVVQDGQVKIVDEFTGRIMEGRRWSEGLHQAVEAKEGVKIEAENITVATITIQNYFRLYEKLAGMTGTAYTEAQEFHEIYKLGVVPIPTNRPMARADYNDLIYKTKDEKFDAVISDVQERNERGQPVLVGTISVEVSEYLSGLLEKHGIKHNVLNAKNHAKEAEIIAEAGQPGAVTIATNMAGRGVDIKLGPGVIDVGGLAIVGTERHESRRIDNQLRGRSGRQGDPGESRFYLSAEDDLVRLFAGDRIYTILDKLGPGEGEPIEHKMLTKRIEGAQKRVEEQNFDIRKNVLKYDDVLNKQREVIYAERHRVLEGESLRDTVLEWIDETLEQVVESHTDSNFPEEWDIEGLFTGLHAIYEPTFTAEELGPLNEIDREELIDRALADARSQYEEKEARLDEHFSEWLKTVVGVAVSDHPDDQELAQLVGGMPFPIEVDEFTAMHGLSREQVLARLESIASEKGYPAEFQRQIERYVLLDHVDRHWREHLDEMDYLREGIHLRGMAQKDPLVEYKVEGHSMFEMMLQQVRSSVSSILMHAEIEFGGPPEAGEAGPVPQEDGRARDYRYEHDEASALEAARGGASSTSTFTSSRRGGSATSTPVVQQHHRDPEAVGRNDPCPCGSGKKYKRCHGAHLQ